MNNFDIIVPAVLTKLHIGAHRKGFEYLKETLVLLNNNECKNIKDAYIIIANKHYTTPNAVKIAVRRAVKDGILECPKETKISIFGYDIDEERKYGRNYYTVREFIPYVIAYINSII